MPGAVDVRELIAGLVASVRPFDAREAADQAGIADWIASGQPLFRTVPPDTPPRHLVVYFVPVDPASRCLLLGDHRKSGLWLPPGGHVEEGEDPRAAVVREAREELGIEAECADGRPFFLTVTPTVGANSHLDVSLWFVLRLARRGARITPDPGEFNRVRWLELDEQGEWPVGGYDPEMRRFVAKLKARQREYGRYPGDLLSAAGQLYGGERTVRSPMTGIQPDAPQTYLVPHKPGIPHGRREFPATGSCRCRNRIRAASSGERRSSRSRAAQSAGCCPSPPSRPAPRPSARRGCSPGSHRAYRTPSSR